MKIVKDSKRIVASLPKGKGLDLIRVLHEKKHIETCNIDHGRGRSTTVHDAVSYGDYAEVDVVVVIVDTARADEIFEFMLFEANINHPHGGFLYQISLTQSTEFMLPDIVEEE